MAAETETENAHSNTETVTKAVDSLLKWRTSRLETEKPKLFDQDEEFVYLVLTLKKIPQNGRVNPHKVPIPHSLLSESSELCLIIDDRANKPERITKDDAQKKIKSELIPISKVLKLSKLASDYRPFEAKRKLCNSYDLFFAEKTIVPLLPRLLGKQFFKKRKVPVQIDLQKKNWKEQVEKACSSALMFLRTGTCSVLRVAKLSMERDEIVENVVAAMDGVVEVFPKKWGVVRSFHVKLLDSVSLPVYQSVPDVRLKIEGVKDVEEALEKSEKKKVRDGKKGGKKGAAKGRIHEIKYMDGMSEDGMSEGHDDVDGDVDSDDVVVGGGDKVDDENGEIESGGLVNKKRKKGVKGKKGGDSSELGSVKSLKDSAKRKKKLSVEDEGSDKKKKKVSAVKAKEEGLVNTSGKKEGSAKKKKEVLAVKAAEGDLIKKGEKKLPVKDEGSNKKEKKVLAVKSPKEGLIKKGEKRLSAKDEGSDKKKKKTGRSERR
ncbi:uncharacterized protein [Cicer arietinum]|uniref:Ribosomal L1 domain-containing protein 1-like n=1 Tax=Cicer arietinum TaxID=3827 RepID=A0A1S2XG44_CICAR|nr:ribosomal L1 domain-containing protein 1-like [Cicer arietinum]